MELCVRLIESGHTPSIGTVRACLQHAGAMAYCNSSSGMSGTELDREYWDEVSDLDLIRAATEAARAE